MSHGDATPPPTSYYFMKSFRGSDGCAISEEPHLAPPLDNWFFGSPWTQAVPQPLVFRVWPEDQGRMLSYFPNFPLMSDALLSALAHAGVDNLDTYTAEIHEEGTGHVYHNYKAVNVIGVVSGVDEARSRADTLGIGEARFYHRLELDESRLLRLPLFRLREAISNIIVHKDVRDHIVGHGFTDIDFLHPRDFRG